MLIFLAQMAAAYVYADVTSLRLWDMGIATRYRYLWHLYRCPELELFHA